MNKKGWAGFYWLMMAVIIFVLAMALAPSVGEVDQEAMDNPHLNCSTTTDDQTKAVCTQIDLFLPLFTLSLIAIAGVVIFRGTS